MSRRRRGGKRGRHEQILLSAVCTEDGLNSWIDFCGGHMFVVGYTEGGAPYGHVEWAAIGAEHSSDGGRAPIADQTLKPF